MLLAQMRVGNLQYIGKARETRRIAAVQRKDAGHWHVGIIRIECVSSATVAPPLRAVQFDACRAWISG
ncbi:hypothetical protein D3C72_2426720 [compost metagenome]